MKSREVHLVARPEGLPKESDFTVVETDVAEPGEGEVVTHSNFMLMEARRGEKYFWAGRTTHVLVPEGETFRMKRKTINLVDAEGPIGTLAFLI